MRLSQRVMDLVGTEWCGNRDVPRPPTLYAVHWHNRSVDGEKPTRDHLRFHVGDVPDYDPAPYLVRVFAVGNDGFDLQIGYPNEWQFHCSRAEALRLAWYVLWTWRVRTEWCGLRRWIYYRALRSHVRRRP